jgi:hypothetical protein
MKLSSVSKWVLAASLVSSGFWACVGGSPATAQGIIYGGIAVTIVDQTGAVINGATVTAVNDSTGTALQGKSNAEGAFLFTNVPIGSYTLSISASGFAGAKLGHVVVVAGNATPIKQVLSVNSTGATIEVEAGAAQVMNTESAQGELAIDSAQLESAPIDGAMDNMTLVVPGVVATHSDGMSNTNGTNFSVNGERGRSNNSEIDGQSNNDNMISGPSFFFSNQDAVQELQIVTNDFSAQYGRNMGSVVNYVTKNGTNTFHGSGFEYYTGSFLSSLTQSEKASQYGFCPPGSDANYAAANGCGLITNPRFVENNWGGTLGGPIIKDKLFFFGSTFWTHEYEAGATDTSSGTVLPDATGLQQLQAAYPNNPAIAELAAYGPQSVKAGNPGFFNPTMVNVTDGTTPATIEVAEFKRNLQSAILDQEHLGRIDYQLTQNDRFYLRYNYQNNPFLPAFYLYGAESIAAGGYANVNGITHQVGGDWTHTFTPSMTNQLRYGFQQSNIAFESGTIPNCTISSFGPCSSAVSLGNGFDVNGNPVSFGSFGYGAAFPQGRFIKVNQIQDNASWTRSKHTVQFGMEFDHQDSPASGVNAIDGSFNFSVGASGTGASGIALRNLPNQTYSNGITAMLEGNTQGELAVGNPTTPFTEPDLAFYFQDNWKIRPDLTLNLGLRYEYFGQSVDELHSRSVAQQTGSHPFWDTTLPLSATTFPYIKPNYRNVEPRLGMAYTPGYAPKMVVHAGFAINVDPAFYNIFLNAATSAPLIDSGFFNCDGVSVSCLPSSGWNYSTVQAMDASLVPTGAGVDPRLNPIQTVPTNFKNPMAETYTLGIQYQVFPSAVAEVRYVGNHTFGQFQSLNTNPDISAVQAAFPGYGSTVSPCSTAAGPAPTNPYQPNCNYFTVDTVANTAFSIYNGLQTSLTVRNFHHWTGTASYTYSRAIDNVSEIFSTGSGGTTNAFAQDPLNTDLGERGVSGNSYPSVWGIQMTYQEPWFSNQSGILGRILGGYTMNAMYQYNGGQPFNPFQLYTTFGAVPNPNDPQATTSFCDQNFSLTFGGGIDQCRPILSNPKAPMTSIGINAGNGYYNYVTGQPGSRDQFHWLWNNQYEAMALKNPYPGVGRNTLRGDSFNNLDLTIGKKFKVTERVNMLIQSAAFDVLNRAYYGTPGADIDNLNGSFLTNLYAGGSSGSLAGGGAFFSGAGNRNVQLGAKVSF